MAKEVVTGNEALDRALELFPQKLVNEVLDEILYQAMKQIVVPKVKLHTPVETGRAWRSIKATSRKGVIGARIRAGEVAAAVTYSRLRYGKWIEFDRKLEDGSVHKGNRALRRGIYDGRKRVRKYTTDELQRQIPNLTRRIFQMTNQFS
jgi:hypothetical protein